MPQRTDTNRCRADEVEDIGRSKNKGATTADEIRKAVKAAWKKVTPKDCEKIAEHVYKNMGEVIRLMGGNFYTEAK